MDPLEEFLNNTPQFQSLFAIETWVSELTVPELLQYMSRYSLNINGQIGVLQDRLARFVALQRGYDEIEMSANDRDETFLRDFSRRLQESRRGTVTTSGAEPSNSTWNESAGGVYNLPRVVTADVHRGADEDLISLEEEEVRVLEPTRADVTAGVPPRRRARLASVVAEFDTLAQDNLANEPVSPIRPISQPVEPPPPQRVTFALSSTARQNNASDFRAQVEREVGNLTYSVPSGARQVSHARTATVAGSQATANTIAQTSGYLPPFSLAGVPTRADAGQSRGEPRMDAGENRRVPRMGESADNFANSGLGSSWMPRFIDKRKIIREWKLKFKGGTDKSAEEFLCRVEEARQGTNITDEELLNALSDLLEGTAAMWARLEKHRWSCWEDFVSDFREHFGDPQFQMRIQHESLHRTQGPKEPVMDYITNYRHVLKYLYPQPDLEMQLSLVYNNLLPDYKKHIDRVQFSSFRELEVLGKKYEAVCAAERLYRPPPPPELSALPEFAYSDPDKVKGNKNSTATIKVSAIGEASELAAVREARPNTGAYAQGASELSAKESRKSEPQGDKERKKGPDKGKIRCFKCQGFGHYRRECPTRKKGKPEGGAQASVTVPPAATASVPSEN